MKKLSEIKRDDLDSTFGMCEYEDLAYKIIQFIRTDTPCKAYQNYNEMFKTGYPTDVVGVKKVFGLTDVTDDYALFAMFCADGWIFSNHFPKRTFTVSDAFIKRLHEKNILEVC